jgi:hypothetical protein
MTNEHLAALSDAATQGVWLVNECGFDNYAYTISAPASDGQYSHVVADVCLRDPAKANAALIVALVNAYRAGQIAVIGPDAVERVARAIAPEVFACPRINLNKAAYDLAYQRATAAIAALTGRV